MSNFCALKIHSCGPASCMRRTYSKSKARIWSLCLSSGTTLHTPTCATTGKSVCVPFGWCTLWASLPLCSESQSDSQI
eukprot:1408913-Amphidinium_carterae.1